MTRVPRRVPDLEERLTAAGLDWRTDLRPVAGPIEVGVPESVELQPSEVGPVLVARWGDWEAPLDLAASEPMLLLHFIRLADAEGEPERIATFARQHGLLGLCLHRTDSQDGPGWDSSILGCERCQEELGVSSRFGQVVPAPFQSVMEGSQRGTWPNLIVTSTEPIEGWLYHARRLRGILGMVANLRVGQRIRRQDRTDAHGYDPERGPRRVLPLEHLTPELAWSEVISLANDWIAREGSIAIKLRRNPGSNFCDMHVTATGLRGALAVELAAVLSSPLGVYRCDHCGNPYTLVRDPNQLDKQVRRPRKGVHHYCQACRADDYLPVKRVQARERYWATGRTRQRKSKHGPVSPMISKANEAEESGLSE